MRLRLPPWRWTVSAQILLLVTVSILAAQVAGLVVLFTLPPRPQPPVAMDQALERIRDTLREIQRPRADAPHEARVASDRRLEFSIADSIPTAVQDPFDQRIAALAAYRLGLPEQSVRVVELAPRLRRGFPGRGRPTDRGDFGEDRLQGPPGRGFPPGGELPPPPDGGPGGRGGEPDGDGISRQLDRALRGPPPPEFARRFRFGGGDDGFRRARARALAVFPRGRRGLAVQTGQHWLVVRSVPSNAEALWLRQVALASALTLAALMLPALWIAHRTARRIRAFAEGADRFGRNPDAPLLPEEGPYELRQAAGSFNRMQARIRRLVSDRTMMMAAVSHDLRTPLARVRFRIAELEGPMREAIAEDIQQMDDLISQMLSFTRDALPGAERRRFDLSALAQSLVDDMADAGADATFAGPDRLTVEANLAAVRRILANLLDNALKFAGHARLTLEQRGDVVLAIVEDDGPGVSPDMAEAIFEPFQRVEPSRNRATGGVGLGLAIARNLARGHGGDVVLEPIAAGARFVFSLPLR